ncbi:DUF1990 domain-containing protein [Acidobacteria bacterium AB60]|nr:DUF1990 domain-containing protein [Acidobacteria bacterium AB60]
MFRFLKPSAAAIETTIAAARSLPASTPALLTLLDGPIAPQPPRGFVHDVRCTELGRGREIFERARTALSAWVPFDLGWVRVANPDVPVRAGSIVAVQAHTLGLWSLNLSRITETVDTPQLFGFIYATTRLHVEMGRERFLLVYDPATESVTYLLEAISRPRHPLAMLGYPFARLMQHRFAIESHLRLRAVVNGE